MAYSLEWSMPINIVINKKKDREYRNSIFDEAALLYF